MLDDVESNICPALPEKLRVVLPAPAPEPVGVPVGLLEAGHVVQRDAAEARGGVVATAAAQGLTLVSLSA